MGCNCKKKNLDRIPKEEVPEQVIKIPQTVEELHSMEMKKHAEELAEQVKNGNNNQSNQTSE